MQRHLPSCSLSTAMRLRGEDSGSRCGRPVARRRRISLCLVDHRDSPRRPREAPRGVTADPSRPDVTSVLRCDLCTPSFRCVFKNPREEERSQPGTPDLA